METDEIMAHLLGARRACAEARSSLSDGSANSEMISRMTEILAQLADVTEFLLEERESYAGRLRRTATVRPTHASPIDSPPAEHPAENVTPSPPPPDA